MSSGLVAAVRAVAQTARGRVWPRRAGRPSRCAIALVGHAPRIGALASAALGGPYGAITGASGAIAAVGTVLVGVVRARAEDHPTAECLVVIGGAMLIPSPVAWVVAGVAWVGLALAGVRPLAPLRRA